MSKHVLTIRTLMTQSYSDGRFFNLSRPNSNFVSTHESRTSSANLKLDREIPEMLWNSEIGTRRDIFFLGSRDGKFPGDFLSPTVLPICTTNSNNN